MNIHTERIKDRILHTVHAVRKQRYQHAGVTLQAGLGICLGSGEKKIVCAINVAVCGFTSQVSESLLVSYSHTTVGITERFLRHGDTLAPYRLASLIGTLSVGEPRSSVTVSSLLQCRSHAVLSGHLALAV
jgi:hypothetical protein